ncbi:MAG: shikimate kinase [Acidimicrobiales bacterium]
MSPTAPADGAAGSGTVARDERLVLVGMMGAGKTTLGRLVAARLGRLLVDTDADVERDAR